ncbi:MULTISPECIES: hypothetical protein [unclassified Streptomyces]|uniref:hypothetical protein n=1 Tax=unclassified Streptomyces TaxID=2593676 RepID=UPI002365F6C1|nr:MULTISPECIES: hypothetical protein [unclassified Streptomyces]MDF3144474.1 hypothetical protein [Streptomyces sp. T21Q-yed]WDF43190.1 hypothetical protein PBV52_43590 [Streptomyces sp. T12]
MSAAPSPPTPAPDTARQAITTDPGYQAFWILRVGFTVAPVLFGLDKFANLLVDWPGYLAPWINDIVPGSAQDAMYAVGVIEIVAGLVVAVAPRFGGWLVAGWLAGIIVNLLTIPDYYDIALRDFGLLLGAVALARLAQRYHGARAR